MLETVSLAKGARLQTFQEGPVLHLPGFELAHGPIISPPPAPVEVRQAGVKLNRKQGPGLRYAHIGEQVVVHHEGQLLAEGTHYWVDRIRGFLVGAKDAAEVLVDAAYEAAGERIDFVVGDAAGRLALIQGAEVPRQAQQFEPEVEPQYRKMFRIYRTARGCDIQPVHLFDGPARAGEQHAYAAAIQRSRDCLAPFIRERLQRGAHLRWGAYGDSITALGGPVSPQINTCPNIHRDLDFYFWNYDEAALAGIPRYSFKDLYPEDVPALTASGYLDAHGWDRYGMRHRKLSQHWHLIEWIKAHYGVSVAYRNWGLGSTRSTADENPVKGLQNMSHPQRLAAVLDDGLDVVNIATGMNELGADYTYDNLMRIGSEFRQRGTVVIFCCPLRAHPLNHHRVDAWRKTCDDIERVARDLDSACVQTRLRFDDDALLGWCSAYELGAASATSHPGIRELAEAGKLAIDLFR